MERYSVMQQKINLKFYREKQGISQNQLAKNIGISQSFISALERQEKSPTLRMIYRIAKELNVCPRLLISCTINCIECNTDEKCKCTCNKEEIL